MWVINYTPKKRFSSEQQAQSQDLRAYFTCLRNKKVSVISPEKLGSHKENMKKWGKSDKWGQRRKTFYILEYFGFYSEWNGNPFEGFVEGFS